MTVFPPYRPTAEVKFIETTGYLIPFETADQPCLFHMPESDAHYLACFSTKEKLEAFTKAAAVKVHKIVQIQDHFEFYDSVVNQVTVMVDPYVLENGHIRWTQLAKNGVLPPVAS